MKVHKGKVLIAGAAAVTLALTACSGSSSGSGSGKSSGSGNTSSGSGQLVFGESTAFTENLQPLIAAGNATSTANLEVRMLNGPYRITPQFGYQLDPDQVSGTPTNKLVNGQQVVEFKINPKAVWDDGKPITADDWVFTWQTEKSSDPKQGGCAALLSTLGWDQLQTVDAVDAHTVRMTFKKGQNFPDWQIMLVSAPLSKHIFDKGSAKATCDYITKGWPTKNGLPAGVTNGPWVLQQKNINITNKTFVLTPNPRYWGSKPKLARLVDQYIGSDSDTNVKALQNQEVNMIYPSRSWTWWRTSTSSPTSRRRSTSASRSSTSTSTPATRC